MRPVPGRTLLKLSGGILAGPDSPLDPAELSRVTEEIVAAATGGVAVVVGGGNILRGTAAAWIGDRVRADAVGMTATVINALALQACLERRGLEVVIQSAIAAEGTDSVRISRACEALRTGAIVLFAGGTGNPYVTTDTAAAIRAASIGAELLAKGSNVDGVFTSDPATSSEAMRIGRVSFAEYLEREYGVMDQAAVQICRDQGVPIRVFDATRRGAIQAVLRREGALGTLIDGGEASNP